MSSDSSGAERSTSTARTAVVTDSTAMLDRHSVEELGIRVVPLQVVIGADSFADGVDEGASPDNVARALREYQPVSTSRPSPEAMLEAYRAAVAEGAEEIVSVHLSGEVSATVESALLAARRCDVPVDVVDTHQIGAGTGFAAVSAARVALAGGSAQEAGEAARRRASDVTSLFYVDTLEYLRRGGRVGAAAALLGSALAVKPLLEVREGKVAPKEKVRTSTRALARLADLAVAAAGEAPVDVLVSHLASREQADGLAATLGERLSGPLEGREVPVSEVPAVIGAHVGPGLVGVTVAPRSPQD